MMNMIVEDALLVEDAIEAVDHRVGPEALLSDVLELMVRQGVGAVPVVGERSEVLGMVTSGDVLGQLIHDADADELFSSNEPLTARDVMTRSVLCVAEGEPLMEAAHMMVHKDVEQLPVARAGRLIGVVTRTKVLRALHLQYLARTRPEGGLS